MLTAHVAGLPLTGRERPLPLPPMQAAKRPPALLAARAAERRQLNRAPVRMRSPSAVQRRARRSPGKVLFAAAVIVLVVAGVLVCIVPDVVDRATLSSSVGSFVTDAESQGDGFTAACRSVDGPGSWQCVLTTTDQSDTGITYRLTVSGNCWTGMLANPSGMVDLPRRPHDCIHLLDQLTD
jgi:hypothetical protein